MVVFSSHFGHCLHVMAARGSWGAAGSGGSRSYRYDGPVDEASRSCVVRPSFASAWLIVVVEKARAVVAMAVRRSWASRLAVVL